MSTLGNLVVRPHREIAGFDDTMSPRDRLRLVAEKLDAARGGDLGIGYHVDRNGQSQLVFSNLEGTSVVSVPTPLSRPNFDAIMERTLPLAETKFMLYELAKAYDQRTPIMLEGGTAIGKTYTVNLFAKLLYGEKAKIPDFYCNGQTDVSELLGKYVPAGVDPEKQTRIQKFLETEAGKILKAEIIAETSGKYEMKELYDRAAAALGIPLDKSNFEFQLGVLPKAMTAGHDEKGLLHYVADGPGVMLHIQEVGMAAPSVVNALLQIRGEQGRLTKSIQVHQDGGREVEAGPGFFVVFSTNPPGKGFQERFEVDKALARGLVWVNLPDKLSDDSIRIAANKIFSFDAIPPQRGTVVDIAKERELGDVLGGVMAKFHKAYVDMLENGEPGRKQKVPVTLDSLWRVAELVQEVQQPTQDGRTIDLAASLRQAVQGVYVQCLQDKPGLVSTDMRSAGKDTLGAKIMAMLDQHLTNETTDAVTVRGKRRSPKDGINFLTDEAMNRSGMSAPAKKAIEETKVRAAETIDLRELSKGVLQLKGQGVFDQAVALALKRIPPEQHSRFRELLE